MAFPRAAAVAELGWSPPERRDWDGLPRRARGARGALRRRRAARRRLAAARRAEPRAGRRRRSQELEPVQRAQLALVARGRRAAARARARVFLVDIMNPCWICAACGPRRGRRASWRRVGPGAVQLPDRRGREEDPLAPRPRRPRASSRCALGGCDGELLARLPLAPAARLARGHRACRARRSRRAPAATTSACASPQRALDPMWVIDSVELARVSTRHDAELVARRAARRAGRCRSTRCPTRCSPSGMLGDGVAIDPDSATCCMRPATARS